MELPGPPGAHADLMSEELAAATGGASRLILSDEQILGWPRNKKGVHYPNALRRLGRLLPMLSRHRITIFISLRDPADFLISGYCQKLLGGWVGSFESYLAGRGPRDVGWEPLVRSIAALPFQGDLVVWRYEDYAVKRDEVIDLMAGQPLAGRLSYPKKAINQGLSAEAIKDVLTAAARGEADRRRAHRARRAFPKGQTGTSRFDPWSGAERAAAAAEYQAELERLAQLPNLRLL